MSTDNLTQILTRTVSELSDAESLKGLFHQHRDGAPLPSGKALEEIIEGNHRAVTLYSLSRILRKEFCKHKNHKFSHRSQR